MFSGPVLIEQQSLLRFRLLCRPSVSTPGGRRTLKTVEEQSVWFLRKAEASGFRALECGIEQRLWFWSKYGQAILLPAVMFEGTLRVSDPVRFASAWLAGFGPGKAFGFGLLTLFRPSTEVPPRPGLWLPPWTGATLAGPTTPLRALG